MLKISFSLAVSGLMIVLLSGNFCPADLEKKQDEVNEENGKNGSTVDENKKLTPGHKENEGEKGGEDVPLNGPPEDLNVHENRMGFPDSEIKFKEKALHLKQGCQFVLDAIAAGKKVDKYLQEICGFIFDQDISESGMQIGEDDSGALSVFNATWDQKQQAAINSLVSLGKELSSSGSLEPGKREALIEKIKDLGPGDSSVELLGEGGSLKEDDPSGVVTKGETTRKDDAKHKKPLTWKDVSWGITLKPEILNSLLVELREAAVYKDALVMLSAFKKAFKASNIDYNKYIDLSIQSWVKKNENSPIAEQWRQGKLSREMREARGIAAFFSITINGLTILHWAAYDDDVPLAKMAIQESFLSVGYCLSKYGKVAHIAAERGSMKILNWLYSLRDLKEGKGIITSGDCSADQNWPIYWAAQSNQPEAFKFLKNKMSGFGRYKTKDLLRVALDNNADKIVRELVESDYYSRPRGLSNEPLEQIQPALYRLQYTMKGGHPALPVEAVAEILKHASDKQRWDVVRETFEIRGHSYFYGTFDRAIRQVKNDQKNLVYRLAEEDNVVLLRRLIKTVSNIDMETQDAMEKALRDGRITLLKPIIKAYLAPEKPEKRDVGDEHSFMGVVESLISSAGKGRNKETINEWVLSIEKMAKEVNCDLEKLNNTAARSYFTRLISDAQRSSR